MFRRVLRVAFMGARNSGRKIVKHIPYSRTVPSSYYSFRCNSTLGRLDARMAVVYTCKVCGTRSSKSFAKKSYEHGVVIVRCPGCESLHLIADNMGWFKDQDEPRNVEQILAEKGELVTRQVAQDGTIELEERTTTDSNGGEKS